MKDRVRKSDWSTFDMPHPCEVATMNRPLSEEEYQALVSGFIPRDMDDRWFLYVQNDWVYLHRSWTGHCIFKLKLEVSSGNVILTDIHINRDSDQYRSINSEADKDEANSVLTSLLGLIRL
jgi:hypothetical protein